MSVALVTGAASGIGQRTAEVLIEQGHQVLATDINLEGLEAHAERLGWKEPYVAVRRLDVRSADSWRAALETVRERWDRLDYLYNIAGYLKPGKIHDTPVEEIERHLDINARGVILGTRLGGEVMKNRFSGHIINVASMASLAPVPGIGLYTASKYAVRAFSLVAAEELRGTGVSLTVVCPDLVATPMLDAQLDHEEAALSFSGPRALTVDEVVDVMTGKVLRDKPLEIWIPRHRGWLARTADLFPRLGFRLGDLLMKRGLAKQKAWKRSVNGGAR